MSLYLKSLPSTLRYRVEVRNKVWLSSELMDVPRRHCVALVLLDLVYLPHLADVALDLITTDFTHVRLIGDRQAFQAKTKQFDRPVLDRSERLERWVEYISALAARIEVCLYANNHHAGHGPATIRELAERIEAMREKRPRTCLSR